jgi:hypothetical protein
VGCDDVMQVVYRREDSGHMRIANSFVIARNASGKIIRKTDIILDRWEVVNDEDTLRGFHQSLIQRTTARSGPRLLRRLNSVRGIKKPGRALVFAFTTAVALLLSIFLKPVLMNLQCSRLVVGKHAQCLTAITS